MTLYFDYFTLVFFFTVGDDVTGDTYHDESDMINIM